MSSRYSGGVVRKNQLVPTTSSASGIWNLGEATQATKSAIWPYPNISYPISQSLRFRASASAYLSKTWGSNGSSQTFTVSTWVKRGALGSIQSIVTARQNGLNNLSFRFPANNTLEVYAFSGGSLVTNLITTQVFRDPSAWYHLVLAVDTTQATSSNRVKFYVNGTQITAFGTATYPSQNATTLWNQTAATHYFGTYDASSELFDGYMAEVNVIGGQQLDPSSFGSTNAVTGQWQPVEYKGTYGTNGFRLKLNTAALGADSSGNNNNFTPNNFSTSGATNDLVVDVPTPWQPSNTTDIGAVVRGNYCTLNPAIRQYTGVDSTNATQPAEEWADGNLRVFYKNDGVSGAVTGTLNIPNTGKWYFEYTNVYEPNNAPVRYGQWVGIIPVDTLPAYNGTYGGGVNGYGYAYGSEGQLYRAASIPSGQSDSAVDTYANYGTGDVIGVAYDADAATVSWYKNNTLIYTQTSVYSSPGGYTPGAGGIKQNTGSGAWNPSNIPAQGLFNFGATPFIYSPPSGYKSICTTNIIEATIGSSQSAVTAPNRYFDVVTYTGNGSTNTITGLNFAPDFLWIKNRSAVSNWPMHDTIRGAGQQVASNNTGDEVPGGTELASFNSNGFTVSGTAGSYNASANNYVAYAWNAGGANTTNTSGTITSIVRANPTSGFSVITYTGNGSAGATVGHGLGAAPKMLIIKGRNTGTSGIVWHSGYNTNQGQMLIDSTAAIYNPGNGLYFNSTTPGSSVVTLGTSGATNGSAQTYVMYAWAEIRGFSKFGSYTGNGDASGPYIHCGFKPKFVMVKTTSNAGYNWNIHDAVRNTNNSATFVLYPNTNAGDDAYGAGSGLDILSNGFKIRDTGGGLNGSGFTYIYMAFADTPFKNAIAR
jgi:hypothetical protein